MISCAGLTKRFGRCVAVDDATLEIGAGEVCALMGDNGAGKSTLLRMLAGLMRPDSGVASVAGHDPRVSSVGFRAAIGVVPETLALLPELTIEEQLMASGAVYGLDRSTVRKRSRDLLESLALFDLRQTYAREGSHGMRKKTAIAMALLHNPAVLLLDEPFEGVDPASSQAISELFAAMSGRGTTILFSSHTVPVVSRIANRVVIMRQGKVVRIAGLASSGETAEALYFENLGAPQARDIGWLGSRQS